MLANNLHHDDKQKRAYVLQKQGFEKTKRSDNFKMTLFRISSRVQQPTSIPSLGCVEADVRRCRQISAKLYR